MALRDGMKILILSCNTGEGHNSSGKALQTALISRGVECDIEDTLALRSKHFSKAISELYELSIKTALFGWAYRLAERYSTLQLKIKSPVYAFNWLYAKRLAELIDAGHYDGIICVHLFPAEAITRIRRHWGQRIPTIFVMTDYTCIPLLYETELDRYIIAHQSLTEEFIEKGLSPDKLHAVGIPVNEERFKERIPKNDARKLVNSTFGWEEANGNWYLIMGGSMGFGDITGLIRQLSYRTGSQDRIICLCGRNNSLKQNIAEEFPQDGSVKAVSYTDKVALIMDASDILMTKPGGITSTEAIIKNIPLVHINPIKGLEEDNADFFRKSGLALGGTTVAEQAKQALYLCSDKSAQQQMIYMQQRHSNRNCSNDIADIIINMVQ